MCKIIRFYSMFPRWSLDDQCIYSKISEKFNAYGLITTPWPMLNNSQRKYISSNFSESLFFTNINNKNTNELHPFFQIKDGLILFNDTGQLLISGSVVILFIKKIDFQKLKSIIEKINSPEEIISSAKEVKAIMTKVYTDYDKESFTEIFLNSDDRIIDGCLESIKLLPAFDHKL